MKKKILSIALPLFAIVLEALPMGAVMHFGNPDGEPFRQTFSYFNPIHWGYANFAPNLTALLTCILLVLAVVNAIKPTKRRTNAVLTVAVIAAVVSLLPLAVGTLISAGITLSLALTALIAFVQKRNL